MADPDLTPDEKDLMRQYVMVDILRRGGMSKDVRLPQYQRDHYGSSVMTLYRIYQKLGGLMSPQEILR
jgi:hypothetical protein